MEVSVRKVGLLLVVVFTLMFLLGATFTQAAEKYGGLKFCKIGTSVPGGTSYPVGAAIGNLLNKHIKDIVITAEATSGSKDNVAFLGKKEIDLGIVDSSISYQAYKGVGLYEGKPKEIRGLFLLYFQPAQFVVLKDSGIYQIEDLVGKKVSVGTPGSGSEDLAHHILSTYNIEDRVKKQYLGYEEATMAIKDGIIDVCFNPSMIPVSGIVEIAATHDIRILPFEDIMVEKMKEKYGYYMKTTIPAGTYRGIEEDVKVVGVGIEMDVRADLPEDLAYDIVKNLFENLEEIKSAHKAIKSIRLENAFNTAIPLHPGAKKYYKEQGLID